MIYSVYASSLISEWYPENQTKLATVLKNIRDGDSFVFILTNSQVADWNKFVLKHELKDLIQFEMPEFITNGSHPEYGRRLKLFVLSKTAIKESEYVTDTFIRGKV